MQMHESIFSEIYSHLYAIFHRLKKYKKINSKFGFQKRKPDFGFKTENRISGFRLTSIIEEPPFVTNSSSAVASGSLLELNPPFLRRSERLKEKEKRKTEERSLDFDSEIHAVSFGRVNYEKTSLTLDYGSYPLVALRSNPGERAYSSPTNASLRKGCMKPTNRLSLNSAELVGNQQQLLKLYLLFLKSVFPDLLIQCP